MIRVVVQIKGVKAQTTVTTITTTTTQTNKVLAVFNKFVEGGVCRCLISCVRYHCYKVQRYYFQSSRVAVTTKCRMTMSN